MEKKWLILLLSLLVISVAGISVFTLNSTPVQAGFFVTVHVSSVCGNGIVEPGEQCDGANLNGQTCVGLGYIGGTLSCNANCTFNTSACTSAPPPPGGGGGAPPSATKVILQGKAYPGADITVLYDGKVATVAKADAEADFKIEITTLTAGIYNIGLWAEDNQGRRSITFSFTVTVSSGTITTISGIFIPSTIELSKVNLLKGEDLDILGQTAPESILTISVESPQEIIKKTAADEEGDWQYTLDTTILDEGSHTSRAKAESPEGLLSSFSKVLGFYIGRYGTGEVCPRADFNKDGRTNCGYYYRHQVVTKENPGRFSCHGAQGCSLCEAYKEDVFSRGE